MQIWKRGRVTFCVVRGWDLTLQHDQPGVLRLTATHKGFTADKITIKKKPMIMFPLP
jgi:hypothetical protein